MGNSLKDLSPVAHEWLRQNIPRLVHSVHSEGPYAGHVRPTEINRHLHIVAYDTPEVDSHVKQLASYVGEAANHPSIYVTKHGDQGIQDWSMTNPNHQPNTPAHPAVIAFNAR
jgi:hypothetical protein